MKNLAFIAVGFLGTVASFYAFLVLEPLVHEALSFGFLAATAAVFGAVLFVGFLRLVLELWRKG